MNFVVYDLVDQNDDFDIDAFDNDSVNGLDVTSSWPGDTVTIDIGGGNLITYVGTTFYLSDGTQVFTPTDGQVLQNGTLAGASGVTTQGPLDTTTDLGPPCFVRGTLIETADGLCPIETIDVGTRVQTLDHGMQKVRWHGTNAVVGMNRLAPVRFNVGALRNLRPLTVSPQHKVMLTGWQVELAFGKSEVLVAARQLVNGKSIQRVAMRQVYYHHIMFDQHEIILADGVPCESFYPGPQILKDKQLLNEMEAIFPKFPKVQNVWDTARTVLRASEARLLKTAPIPLAA